MKRTLVFIFAGVLLIAVAKVSFSEMRAENMSPSHGMEMKNITPENFSEVKSNILQRIDERLTKLNEEKACVQAASTADELKKCRPPRPGGPGHKGMQKPPQ